jgi:SAM-dependent methyltransferase
VSGHAEERLANDPTSELWGEHRARYRFATSMAIRGSVLDIACGAGFGLVMLRQVVARAIGMDLDAEGLAAARRTHPGLALARADGVRLPLKDGQMDAVVSFETLEHIPDAEALLAELRRVLRPGGQLVLSTPNRDFGPPSLHQGNPYHVREFTGPELRDMLARYFGSVVLYGQWPSAHYRYVPFLLVEPTYAPSALAWKVLNRLPYAIKNRVAKTMSGRSWYPGETDYVFERERFEGAHDILAVAG